jgi:hypothetical protein
MKEKAQNGRIQITTAGSGSKQFEFIFRIGIQIIKGKENSKTVAISAI